MLQSDWNTLSRLRQAREPLAWWQRYLGPVFPAVKPLLSPCEGLAGQSYPCPDSGLRLSIRASGGKYRAFPTGPTAEDVPDRELAWEDVQAWRLNRDALRRGVADALGLIGAQGDGGSADIEFVGYCERSGGRKRVYLCHADGSEAAARVAADVAQTPEAGCLVFTERCSAAEHVLAARGVALVSMAECMTLEAGILKGACAGACRAVHSDMSNVELKTHLDQRLDTMGQHMGDLERENRELKQNLAQVLSNLARKVEPVFFQWIFVILGTGSVNAAARELKIPGSTFAEQLKVYVGRGGLYATLYAMLGVRKKGAGRRRMERFNELFDKHQGPQAVAEPGVLRELLDGLEGLNGVNWKGMREELIAMVKSELAEE